MPFFNGIYRDRPQVCPRCRGENRDGFFSLCGKCTYAERKRLGLCTQCGVAHARRFQSLTCYDCDEWNRVTEVCRARQRHEKTNAEILLDKIHERVEPIPTAPRKNVRVVYERGAINFIQLELTL